MFSKGPRYLPLFQHRTCLVLPRCGTSSPGTKFTWEPEVPHGTLALPGKYSPSPYPLLGLQTLWISKLSRSPSLVFKLSRSPSLVSKLSRSPSSPRRAVTTRIRRVSGKRPAICCLYLWGVIQLLTFPPYFGKHLKLLSTLQRFLHILAFESFWCSLRFPRRSLVAPSMLPRRS